ncbi:MAG: hypothetical protein K5920_10775 [Bacteroidales bacterium]|nr:hypothetical protein [Bacteroidales bacterium]
MKRREFIKITSTAACAAALLPSVGGLMTGCKDLKDEGKAPVTNDSWNFDEVVDRSPPTASSPTRN